MRRNQDFNFAAGIIEKYYTSYKNWKEKRVKVKEAMQKINLITFFFGIRPAVLQKKKIDLVINTYLFILYFRSQVYKLFVQS